MKVVILAGGLGTRLSEETETRPKPMVEIGGSPILWHIMKIYSHYGFSDFVICLGYKGYMVKEYFSNYFLHRTNVTIDLGSNSMTPLVSKSENWRVTLVDTGNETMTGGRLRNARDYIGDETFCMTYGDGVCDVDVRALVSFHKEHGKQCTVTGVQPPGRFGALQLSDAGKVTSFLEKPQGDGAWINGGFFVLEPKTLDLISGEDSIWEQEPMRNLAKKGEMMAYKHSGFWQPMDTLRDKKYLEDLWASKKAPWKLWE